MATIQGIYQTLESTSKGGDVLIKGVNIDVKVDVDIVRFLLRIPDGGANLDQLSSYYKETISLDETDLKGLIQEELLPAGLVYEKQGGIYAVTDVAKNADYTFTPLNERDGPSSEKIFWPGGIFPIPDE